MSRRTLRPVEQFLQQSGLPFSIDLGSRHYRVFVAGKLVTIMPRGSKVERHRAMKNTMATLRRAVREQGAAR